ncbi:MAG: hypothetical protein AB9866_04995 [Syntrophobacteraceae bacterium]
MKVIKKNHSAKIKLLCMIINIVCGVLNNSLESCADPSNNIKYLINEPVSLFEFGLYRLDSHLEGCFTGVKLPEKIMVRVTYKWELNRIQVNLIPGRFTKGNITKQEAENYCKEIIQIAKQCLGCEKDASGNIRPEVSELLISGFFSHKGFEKLNEPKRIEKELINIIQINGIVYDASCQSNLLDSKIYFTK